MRREIRLSRRILASAVRREWRNLPERALIRLCAIELGSEGGWRSGAGAKSTTRSCSDFGSLFAWVGRIRRSDLSDRLTKLHILTADAIAQTPSLVCPPADDEQGCADFCEGYIDAALRDHEWLLADRGTTEVAPLILLTKAPSSEGMSDEERALASALVRLHLHEHVAAIHEALAPTRAALEIQSARTAVNQTKVGRNAPCPCGSGTKFKRCCGRPGQPKLPLPKPIEREDEKYELVDSPLCRSVTEDGVTVNICIYRGPGDPGWLLEIEDHLGGSTVWDGVFDTDQQALDEALETIEQDGIESFAAATSTG